LGHSAKCLRIARAPNWPPQPQPHGMVIRLPGGRPAPLTTFRHGVPGWRVYRRFLRNHPCRFPAQRVEAEIARAAADAGETRTPPNRVRQPAVAKSRRRALRRASRPNHGSSRRRLERFPARETLKARPSVAQALPATRCANRVHAEWPFTCGKPACVRRRRHGGADPRSRPASCEIASRACQPPLASSEMRTHFLRCPRWPRKKI